MGNNNGKPVVFTDEVNLNHFRLLRVVGKGAFGKVRIVERKDTGLTFALKYIRKDEVVRSESVRNIIRERRMLEHLNHPFICNLRYSFQDIEYLYLVVDLMNGGDLRFHISRKTFTEDTVKFWIAQIACALEYTHSQGIVHRDVKPDNILLDSDGHCHLADFNVASEIHPDRPLTSKSGTLAYLAPEVYAGRGYGPVVDFWSLGVVFYECIFSRRPFTSDSHRTLADEIMRADITYPITNPPVSMACMSALRGFLNPDPNTRLGAVGFDSITNHPFFSEFDFDALLRKEIQPVFVPSKEKTHFDATYDLEELLLEEAPLEARARRQRPREALKDDATAKEIREEELHRMIETMFEPFDYTTAQYDKIDVENGEPVLPGPLGNPNLENVPPSKELQYPPGAEPRAITTSQRSEGHAQPVSSNGSPPIPSRGGSRIASANHGQRGSPPPPTPEIPRSVPPEYQDYSQQRASPPRPHRTHSGSARNQSIGGGVQVTLDETGSWAGLTDPNHPSNSGAAVKPKQSGMLAFLSKKKGRGSSPKPQERGVLGKEGARVVIGQ